MTVGEKIRKIRNLRGMTQKELGVASGFSSATADVRIRQYESNKMVPKNDKLNAIASALGVDVSALSNINISSYEELMHVFFELEDCVGLTISQDEKHTILSIDRNNKGIALLNSFLSEWNNVRDKSSIDSDEYQLWKCRFPLDLRTHWDSLSDDINGKYHSLKNTTTERLNDIHTIADFLQEIRKWIEHGLSFSCQSVFLSVGSGSLAFTFDVYYLLQMAISEPSASDFADFLALLDILAEYGLPKRSEFSLNGQETRISYYLDLSPLSSLADTIWKLQDYITSSDASMRYDTDNFELEYEGILDMYNIDLRSEIRYYYPGK